MAGIPLKSGADFYNLEASRMRLHNLGADPTEFGLGQIYYNSSSGNNTSGRARLYTGTGFRSLAFMEDIAAIQEQLDLLTGEVDTDAIISNMKEVSAFLEGFAEEASLMDYLNTELGKKLDKTGGTIDGSILIGKNDNTEYKYLRITRVGNVVELTTTGSNGQLMYNGVGFSFNETQALWNSNTLLHEGNYSKYALPLSGGTIDTIDIYGLNINSTSDSSGILLKVNNDNRGALLSGGTWGTAIINPKANYNAIGILDTSEGGYAYFSDFMEGKKYPLLHSGNIGEYNAGGIVNLGNPTTDTFANYIAKYAKGANVVINESGAAVGNIGKYESVLNIGTWHGRFGRFAFTVGTNPILYFQTGNDSGNAWGNKKTIAFTDSNVASAQALTHSNGTVGATVDEYGGLCLTTRGIRSDGGLSLFDFDNTHLNVGYSMRNSYMTDIYGNTIRFMVGDTSKMLINSSGNVTIGASDLAGTDAKLYVGGDIATSGNAYFNNNKGLAFKTADGTKDISIYVDNNDNLHLGYHNLKNVRFDAGNVLIGTTTDAGYKLYVDGTARISDAVKLGHTLSVGGDTTINGNLHVKGNIIADKEVSAGGAAEESGEGGGGTGGGVEPYVFTFTPSTTTVSVNHNISSEDVIVQVYEKDATSGKWSVVLVDIEIVDSTRVDLHFGRTETTEHKVVIIG